MNTNNDIKIFFENEPLLEAEVCARQLAQFPLPHFGGKSIFFGIGLCTSTKPARAVPFDILSFFLVANRLKQLLGLSKVTVLIADTHARTNSFMTENMVNNLTKDVEALSSKIIQNLHLPDFEILIHSKILQTDTFQTSLASLPSMDNQYLRNELADILWLHTHRNLGIKLGWTIDSTPTPSGHDERFFDTELIKHVQLPIAFLHGKAGRTFDKHRQKVSPYISVRGEKRILLTQDENVSDKFACALQSWHDPHFGGTTKHLAAIVRAFEKQCGHIASKSLEQKTQHIIDIIFEKERL